MGLSIVKTGFYFRFKLVAGLVLIMIAVHLVNVSLGGQLNQFGIVPRSLGAWPYILTAPFIHGSVGHLVNNLVGLSVFSILCLIRSPLFFLGTSVFVIVVGGSLVWLFARDAMHIGASGWVFGLWGLSITIGWFDRRFISIVMSLFVLLAYGGMIYGVLPMDSQVSFESHLFGVVAGILCAFLYTVFGKPVSGPQSS